MIKLADTIKPITDGYPAVEGIDIDVNIDGNPKRLQDAIDDGDLAGGSDKSWVGSHDEWEELTIEEKSKYKFVYFNDDTGEPESVINDDVVSKNTAWSSKKISDEAEIKRFKDIEYSILGYNVPDECPIKNEIDGNMFFQKVGRSSFGIELPEFSMDVSGDIPHVFYGYKSYIFYINDYTKKEYDDPRLLLDKEYCQIENELYVKDESSNTMEDFISNNKNIYWYYSTSYNPLSFPIEGYKIQQSNAITVVSSINDGTTILVKDLTDAGITTGSYLVCANRYEQNSGSLFYVELMLGTASGGIKHITLKCIKLAGDGTTLEEVEGEEGRLTKLAYRGGDGEGQNWRVALSFMKFNDYSPF